MENNLKPGNRVLHATFGNGWKTVFLDRILFRKDSSRGDEYADGSGRTIRNEGDMSENIFETTERDADGRITGRGGAARS